MENLFTYRLCGGKCPIRWLNLLKETKHKINSIFKCQYQAWKGQYSSLCLTCEHREVPTCLWIVLHGLLRAFLALSFWESISASWKLEWRFTVFFIQLVTCSLTEYTVPTHTYLHLSLDVWFWKTFWFTSEIISAVLAPMHLKLFAYSFKRKKNQLVLY